MNHYLIEKSDPRVADLLRRMEKVGKTLGALEVPSHHSFKGKRFISDKELSANLRISRRTLQEYRSEGVIPYYLICGKIMYEETEIQRYLEKCRRQSIEEQGLL